MGSMTTATNSNNDKSEWHVVQESDIVPKVQSVGMSQPKQQRVTFERPKDTEYFDYFKDNATTYYPQQPSAPAMQPAAVQKSTESVKFEQPKQHQEAVPPAPTKGLLTSTWLNNHNEDYFDTAAASKPVPTSLLGSEVTPKEEAKKQPLTVQTAKKPTIAVLGTVEDDYYENKHEDFLKKYPQYRTKPITVTPVIRSVDDLSKKQLDDSTTEEPLLPFSKPFSPAVQQPIGETSNGLFNAMPNNHSTPEPNAHHTLLPEEEATMQNNLLNIHDQVDVHSDVEEDD